MNKLRKFVLLTGRLNDISGEQEKVARFSFITRCWGMSSLIFKAFLMACQIFAAICSSVCVLKPFAAEVVVEIMLSLKNNHSAVPFNMASYPLLRSELYKK